VRNGHHPDGEMISAVVERETGGKLYISQRSTALLGRKGELQYIREIKTRKLGMVRETLEGTHVGTRGTTGF